jgi:hypothetical protein
MKPFGELRILNVLALVCLIFPSLVLLRALLDPSISINYFEAFAILLGNVVLIVAIVYPEAVKD